MPDRAEIGIDIRTIPGMRHGLLRDQIASYLGPEVELAPVVDVESVWTDPPWMREVFGICADVQDTAAIVEAAPYFTDASALTPALGGVPTVMSVPATRTWHTRIHRCLILCSTMPISFRPNTKVMHSWP